MPYTPTGAYYSELGGSPTYQVSTDSASASDLWMVPWGTVFGFTNTIIPAPVEVGGQSYQPARWAFRYDSSLKADSVSVTPFYGEEPGITGNSPASAWAKMKVSYKVPDKEEEEEEDEDDPETFLTHKLTIGAEMMTVPPRSAMMEGSQSLDPANSVEDQHTDEDAPITILMPTAEHQFTWKKVISPPFSSIYNLMGCVNKSAFLGADAETLMFLGCDATQEYTTGGVNPWTLDYRFSHRVAQPIGAPNPLTWNHFYVPKKGEWNKLEFGPNKDHAYHALDFSDLFN